MPSDGEIRDGDVVVVCKGTIRADLYCYTPNELPEDKRRTMMMTVEDAMCLVILLSSAIEQSNNLKGRK